MDSDAARYQQVFLEAFAVDKRALLDLTYQSIQAWDSIGHMALIASIEEEFGIELDIDDITSFSSFSVGADILSKYGLEVAAS